MTCTLLGAGLIFLPPCFTIPPLPATPNIWARESQHAFLTHTYKHTHLLLDCLCCLPLAQTRVRRPIRQGVQGAPPAEQAGDVGHGVHLCSTERQQGQAKDQGWAVAPLWQTQAQRSVLQGRSSCAHTPLVALGQSHRLRHVSVSQVHYMEAELPGS